MADRADVSAKPWITGIFAAGAAAATAGLLRSRYERAHFVTETFLISSGKLKKPRTAVFITDLHDQEFGAENGQLLAAVRAVKPDLILVGGDMMVAKPGKADLLVTQQLLGGLCDIRDELSAESAGDRETAAAGCPRHGGACAVFYANGNHEQRLAEKRETYGSLYRDLRRFLAAMDITCLSDGTARPARDLAVSGLNLTHAFYRDWNPGKMKPAYLSARLGAADPEPFHILLAHSPLFFDAYAAWGADLVLSGHFHGGTIRLPRLGGVMTPQYQFFHPYCSGFFQRGESRMIVGRGLGTHSIRIRIGNLPQLVVVRLVPSGEAAAFSDTGAAGCAAHGNG